MNHSTNSARLPQSIAPLLTALVVAVFLGVLIGKLQTAGVVIAIALLGLMITTLWPELTFGLVIGSLVLGQLVRLPLPGGEAFILPNDILIPILVVGWLFRALLNRNFSVPRSSIWLPLGLMTIIMGWSIFINRADYDVSELLGGSFYILRWIEYAALFVVTAGIARDQARSRRIVIALVASGVILAILGFIQLKLVPDFSFMTPQGWDPHIGRLLSTWFDPNFLAGFLVAISAITLTVALRLRKSSSWWWIATAVFIPAIILTYSRSGYLALAAAFGLITLFRSRLLLYLGLIGLTATVLFVPRVQERVIGIRSVDETAKLRILSWENALAVIESRPVFGVGYNLYREAQTRANLIKDPTAHSATGSDSSLLLITATTGLVGLGAYIWLLIAIGRDVLRAANHPRLEPYWRAIAFGTFASFVALLVHGQFVNGLLFPHLMEYIWIITGVLVARTPENTA